MKRSPVRLEKPLLFLAVIGAWACAYLAVNRWVAERSAEIIVWDPVWSFPLVPAFVVPYLSAFLLPFFAAAALRDRMACRRFALLLAAVMAVSAAAFILMPLTLPRPSAGEGAFARLLDWLYSVDRPVNLFPSLHVSMSFLFAKAAALAWPRRRALFLAWASLVAVSALFIRQHYVVDVVGGLILAHLAWNLYPPQRASSA